VFVFLYMVDNITQSYLAWLILMGMGIHFSAILVIREKIFIVFKNEGITRPNYFNVTIRFYIRETLPLASVVLYISNYFFGVELGKAPLEINSSLALIVWFIIPTIMYLLVLSYLKRKYLSFFNKKIPFINRSHLIILCAIFILSSK